jgi:CHC2 zinc finger
VKPSVFDCITVADILHVSGHAQPNRHGLTLCPVHAEKTPSFHVLRNGRGFRCFGCGVKGGVSDLPILLGICTTRAEAARWLESII